MFDAWAEKLPATPFHSKFIPALDAYNAIQDGSVHGDFPVSDAFGVIFWKFPQRRKYAKCFRVGFGKRHSFVTPSLKFLQSCGVGGFMLGKVFAADGVGQHHTASS